MEGGGAGGRGGGEGEVGRKGSMGDLILCSWQADRQIKIPPFVHQRDFFKHKLRPCFTNEDNHFALSRRVGGGRSRWWG